MPMAGVNSQGGNFCRSLRRCALALSVVAAGCGDAPVEAPLTDAAGLRSIREAPAVSPCEHTEASEVAEPELIPLPALDEPGGAALSAPATSPEVAPESIGPTLLPPMDLAELGFTEITAEPPAVVLPQFRLPAPPQAALPEDANNPHMAEAELLLRIWPRVAAECANWRDVERLASHHRWVGRA